jgi:hypothetical protein
MKTTVDNPPHTAAGHGKDKSINLTVQTTRGTAMLTFEHNDKVSDVIAAVVRRFGFGQADVFSLVLASKPAEPLDPHRTLQSLHLTDGTCVILTATGNGV